jgi:hypothetical protein
MNKSEFKEMYLKRMHNYWKKNQNIPKDYAILMCDGQHTDFCTSITADENISIADKLIQYGRACRKAVLNGGAIEGIKYTEDQIVCTIFLSEAWFSKSSQTSGIRPCESTDKETVIIFQFIDSIMRETTYYHDVDGELTEYDKDIVYFKNTN